MKVFIYSHDGVYLTGYSVIIAESEAAALAMLRELLTEHKLSQENIRPLAELPTNKPIAKLVWEGDY